ncbi:MAG: phytanoyl-CoA dioxygenase [Myxococcales bacterium]|nr:phytanoyl-CoA dioxygenase [Myxococcales bacterium]
MTSTSASTEMTVASPALPEANRRITMPAFVLDGRLTREQAEFLDDHGFIRFRRFADRATVEALGAEQEAIDRRLIAEGRTTINGVPMIIGTRADGSRYIQRMVFSSLQGETMHRFLGDPRFGAILEVAGPDYRIGERERDGLVINHFRREEGSRYKQLGWHTDSLRDLFYFEKPRRYLNVGIYLDDSPITKGGVRLIPHTHRQSIWKMLTRKWHFLDNRPDREEYAVEAEAGDLTIHDGRIWHRVAQATATGEASRRRVMYLPLMNGPEKLKHAGSPTPLYHRLKRFVG